MASPVSVVANIVPGVFDLPAPDASLPDLLASVDGLTVWLALGVAADGSPAAVGPGQQGNVAIPAGGIVRVRGTAANVTRATALGQQAGAVLTVQRVPAGFITVFPCLEA